MAAAPTVVPSSSSTLPIPQWDVFLSFEGEDTPHNFNFPHDLYAALVKEGIKTFKDVEKLRRGELMSEALDKAIKESRVFIIIFSMNHVNCRLCQEELTLIMERWEKHGQKVFPVFLTGVDRLNAQHQKWSYGELEERFGPEKGERWRSALRTAAQLYGWCFKDFGLTMVFTEEIPSLFNNLKEITVRHCMRLEVIIEAKEEEGEEDEEEEVGVLEGIGNVNGGVFSLFPRLEVLKLEDLPTLAAVCTNHMLRCPLIRKVRVSNCPKLRKDPLRLRNKDGLPVLEDGRWNEGDKVMEG